MPEIGFNITTIPSNSTRGCFSLFFHYTPLTPDHILYQIHRYPKRFGHGYQADPRYNFYPEENYRPHYPHTYKQRGR